MHTFEINKCGQKCFCVLLYKKYSGGKKIMEKTYNVSEAASVIGVSVKTLQRWDREGKLVADRTPSNRRFYTEKQIHDIYNDKEVIEENSIGLIEAISNMKNGDVILIETEDGCPEYITKTKWFDVNIYIIGGIGRIKTTVFSFYESEDIDPEKLIQQMENTIKERIMLSRRKTKGKMEIKYFSDEVFRENVIDNFQYRMQ